MTVKIPGPGAGCGEARVLTGGSNTAAIGLYAAVGGVETVPDPVMFSFPLGRGPAAPPEAP